MGGLIWMYWAGRTDRHRIERTWHCTAMGWAFKLPICDQNLRNSSERYFDDFIWIREGAFSTVYPEQFKSAEQQISCSYLTLGKCTRIVVPVMATRMTWSISNRNRPTGELGAKINRKLHSYVGQEFSSKLWILINCLIVVELTEGIRTFINTWYWGVNARTT